MLKNVFSKVINVGTTPTTKARQLGGMAIDKAQEKLLLNSLKKGKQEFFERVAVMNDKNLVDYFSHKLSNNCIYNPDTLRSTLFTMARQDNKNAVSSYIQKVKLYHMNNVDGFNSFSIVTGYGANSPDSLWNEPRFVWFETAEGYEWFMKYVAM